MAALEPRVGPHVCRFPPTRASDDDERMRGLPKGRFAVRISALPSDGRNRDAPVSHARAPDGVHGAGTGVSR